LGRYKKGNYIFFKYKTDHYPDHVHVIKGDIELAKVRTHDFSVIHGRINSRIKKFLIELR
jgi:hypothetical protein